MPGLGKHLRHQYPRTTPEVENPAPRGQPRQEFGKPVAIGSDVWVGGGAVICPGVTIGSRTVIGAGSVVTRDIPDGVFAAGNPCRVVRAITE